MKGQLAGCEVRQPASLPEALDLLAQEPGAWTPFAGGTDLMVLHNAGRLKPRRFLDLSRLQELRGIQAEGEVLTFGALTTFTEVREHGAVVRGLPNLARSAQATGALAIQNRGTLGGNLVNASPAADTPPSLLAYGAEVELVSARGRRTVPYDAFHLGYKRMDLAPDELLLRIHIPVPQGDTFHHYRKVGTRQAQAISKTCLAACVRLDAGRVAEIRIGLGAVAPTPVRARHAEAAIQGSPLDALPLARAREALQRDLQPIDDLRASAHYRRVVTGNLLVRMLEQLGRR